MERVGINTAQNVAIDYEIASVGDRILATILDYIIFFAYFILLIIIISTGFIDEDNIALWSLSALPILFYDLYCEILFSGQSFGKYVMKIKVIKLNGTQPNFGSYLLRWLFRLIDMRMMSGIIALITILLNGKGQRLGDIVAGTTVIKNKRKVSLKDTILNEVQDNYQVVFKEVEQLSDKDIGIIKSVLQHSLKHKKWEVIDKLADKTQTLLNIKTDLKPLIFLNTIIKDYTHFQFEK